MKDLISIIVPVYNVEGYLEDCVASLSGQTYENLEILLVDDGSTDASPEICDALAARDPRIQVIRQKNRGPGAARNAGIDQATGEYLLFVDSDDKLHRECCRVLWENLQKTRADMSICNYRDVNTLKNSEADQTEGQKLTVCTGREAMNLLYTREFCIRYGVLVFKLYKKQSFATLRIPEDMLHEDTYITPPLLDTAKKIVYTDAVLYYVQSRPASITRQYNKKRLAQMDALLANLNFYREKGYRELYEKAYGSYLHCIRNHYFMAREHMPDDRQLLRSLSRRFREEYQRCDVAFPFRTKLEFTLFLRCKPVYRLLWKGWKKMTA